MDPFSDPEILASFRVDRGRDGGTKFSAILSNLHIVDKHRIESLCTFAFAKIIISIHFATYRKGLTSGPSRSSGSTDGPGIRHG